MREIIFRGKRLDNCKWIYGNLCDNIYGASKPIIITDPEYNDSNRIDFEWEFVNSSTIGQYTGLTDKNDNKIFEGDIIRVDDTENAVVEYNETSAFYMAVFNQAESDFGSLIAQYPNVEVIGNIHDNPELLKLNNEG